MARRFPEELRAKQEEVLTTREIFFKYVLNNKLLWFTGLPTLSSTWCATDAWTGLRPTSATRRATTSSRRAGYFCLRIRRHSRHADRGWARRQGVPRTPCRPDHPLHGDRRGVHLPLLQFSSNYVIVTMSLIAIRVLHLRPGHAHRRAGARPGPEERRRNGRRTDRVLRLFPRHRILANIVTVP